MRGRWRIREHHRKKKAIKSICSSLLCARKVEEAGTATKRDNIPLGGGETELTDSGVTMCGVCVGSHLCVSTGCGHQQAVAKRGSLKANHKRFAFLHTCWVSHNMGLRSCFLPAAICPPENHRYQHCAAYIPRRKEEPEAHLGTPVNNAVVTIHAQLRILG